MSDELKVQVTIDGRTQTIEVVPSQMEDFVEVFGMTAAEAARQIADELRAYCEEQGDARCK